jgi:glycosyltransferase involved in cell wall biosynthesis
MEISQPPNHEDSPKATVIVSTFNRPDTLEKVIWGFQNQTCQDFELIVADDGSSSETAELLSGFLESGTALRHLWQEDHGFRKNRILNIAIDAANTPYLIFTDGDCIPRADFVETHLRLRRQGYFLSVAATLVCPRNFIMLLIRQPSRAESVLIQNGCVQLAIIPAKDCTEWQLGKPISRY